MNEELKKLIEESGKSNFSIGNAISREDRIRKQKQKDPKNSKIYDILLQMNDDVIKYKNEIQ